MDGPAYRHSGWKPESTVLVISNFAKVASRFVIMDSGRAVTRDPE
jgi:hypothetical protein